MNESHVISKKRCPKCAKLGKDTSHDNLVSYSDGHEYCYACGYYIPSSKITGFIRKDVQPDDPKEIRLPHDIVSLANAPKEAKIWLDQYDIDNNIIIRSNLFWSESRQRLIFPYFINGNLIAWQGRWFGKTSAAKWYTDGKIDQHLYVIGPNKGTIVLTEDTVSAMKLSKYIAASPVFGSVISAHRFKSLKQICDGVIIWLDPDKRKEALKFEKIATLFGLNCKVVISEKDPKEHSYDEIKELLQLENNNG